MRRPVEWIARFVALLGGFVLIALIVLNTLSIIGRSASKAAVSDFMTRRAQSLAELIQWLGLDEINGTYELTEAGVAFAIFAFFPVCQLYGAHATVDVFTSALGQRINRYIRAFWEIALTVTIIFLTDRLYDGMLRYLNNGETTLFLQFPVWWSYAASLAAAIVACITAIYCAFARLVEAVRGDDILPSALGE